MADNKNIIHGDIHAGGNVHIGDITYLIDGKPLVIPFHLTHFIPSNADHVVGRTTELQATREKLLTGKPTVLVNGIGGIGKTTLALKYMVTHTPQYQHLAWLNAAAGVQSAFIGNDALLSALSIKEEVEKLVNAAQLDKAFDCVFKRLNDLAENTEGAKGILVVLDNANDLADLLTYKKYFETAHFHLLITSRAHPLDWQVVEVESLPKEQALELFKNIYPSVNATDEALDALLNKLFYHTLLIELVAKAAKANAMDFERLEKAINDKFIHDPDLQKRKVNVETHSETIGEEVKRAKIEEYIWLIFKNVKELPDQAREMLRAFALLPPATPFDENFLTKHFAQWNITEDIYDDLDINLVERGWLDKDGLRYSLHPLIAEVVVKHLEVDVVYADGYIMCISGLIKYNNNNSNDNLFEKKQQEPLADQLVKLFFDKDTKGVAELLHWLSWYYLQFGSFTKSTQYAKQALAITLRIPDVDLNLLARCHSVLSHSYKELGNYQESAILLERCLELTESDKNEKNLNLSIYQSNLAVIYRLSGRFEEGIFLLEKAISVDKKKKGPEHPATARHQSALGLLYRELGESEKSVSLLEDSLSSNKKNYGLEHPEIALNQMNLAMVYQDLGRYDDAIILMEKVLSYYEKNFESDHPFVARAQSNLATVYINLKQYAEAHTLLEKALASDIKILGHNHPKTAICKSNLAYFYQETGQLLKAQILFNEAYQTFLTTLGKNHPTTQMAKQVIDLLPPQ